MSASEERSESDYLNRLRKSGTAVSVYLSSGVRFDGRIKSFDFYTLRLLCPDPVLIVKSSIASVQPRSMKAATLTRITRHTVPRTLLVSDAAANTPAPVVQRKVRRMPVAACMREQTSQMSSVAKEAALKLHD